MKIWFYYIQGREIVYRKTEYLFQGHITQEQAAEASSLGSSYYFSTQSILLMWSSSLAEEFKSSESLHLSTNFQV